jgi:DNA-binding NarL/FixJ family response regulator
MRPTRVLYVENDPALRGILSHMLDQHGQVELITSVGSPTDALEAARLQMFDVALLDLALGHGTMNGLELGIALRKITSDIGIVIYSQHAVSDFADTLPESFVWGWSVLQKRANVDLESLVAVLRSTAQGHTTIEEGAIPAGAEASSLIGQLSSRQREIMAYAATGVDSTVIAEALGLAQVTVREHLSNAYQVLVPEPRPGTDLRTTAVLRYLKETRRYAETADE